MGVAARREALAARWHLTPEDVVPLLGPIGARWWQVLVYTQDARDIVFNLQYRVEAGSAKRPNKDRDRDQANQLMQTMFQPLFTYASSTGNMGPVNALITFFGRAFDIRDIDQFLLTPPPPPTPPMVGVPPGAQQQLAGPPPR